jgi:hypothetical protein
MDLPSPAPLTPEQLAAVNSGDGYARFIDPSTCVVYHLIAQTEPVTVDDEHVREKLAEAQADVDRGDVAEWNAAEIKQELRDRTDLRQTGQ